jgi:hypothetical protein
MVQTIYAFCAILIAGLLSFTVTKGIHGNADRMIVNEVASQARNVADEFLDQMASLPFDPATISGEIRRSHAGFASPIQGVADCNPNHATRPFFGCDTINDVHAWSGSRSVDGLEYDVRIRVNYTNDSSPADTLQNGTSFSKMVRVFVTSPHLRLGQDPMTMEFRRIYRYPRVTSHVDAQQ